MPPSFHHRFYLTDADTIVELHWRAPSPGCRQGLLSRALAFFAGPRADPRQVLDHGAFDRAVDTLATDPDAACAAFGRLGYEVSVVETGIRAAA